MSEAIRALLDVYLNEAVMAGGDTVLFGKYSGQEIKLDGTEFLIMREDEILGVVETS